MLAVYLDYDAERQCYRAEAKFSRDGLIGVSLSGISISGCQRFPTNRAVAGLYVRLRKLVLLEER